MRTLLYNPLQFSLERPNSMLHYSMLHYSMLHYSMLHYSMLHLIFGLLEEVVRAFFQSARLLFFRGIILAVLLFGLLLLAPNAYSQISELNGVKIVNVQIEGLQTVASGEILGRVLSKVGNNLQVELLTQDIKKIHALGFFSNVQVLTEPEKNGIKLIFRVTERLRIGELEVIGSQLLSKSVRDKAITLREGEVLLKSKLEDNLESLRREYRKKGYYKTRVSVTQELLSKGKARVTIVVEEDPRVYVTRIRTQGNKAFSGLQIRRWMRSAEVDCFSWINQSGLFQEERINYDLQAISLEYLQRGYVRVLLKKPKIVLVRKRGHYAAHVDLSIVEGEQYSTRIVDIQGDILGNKSTMLKLLGIKSQEVFNAREHNQDIFRLRSQYQEQGYAFVRVIPDVRINDELRTVDVVYQIFQGERAYIGRIEIQGNDTTHDHVIRREFSLTENTLYNGKKLKESQANLSRLGFFEPSLSVDTEVSDVDNVLNVATKVTEGRTGSFQLQLTYGETTGIQTIFSVAKTNFLGRGQTIRLDLQAAQKQNERSARLSFTEPYLLGTSISSTTSLSFSRDDDSSELERGLLRIETVSQSLSRKIIGLLRGSISVALEDVEFEKDPEYNQQLQSTTLGLSWNTVNHPIFPSSGGSVGAFATNVEGSSRFRRYTLNGRKFFRLDSENMLVLMMRARLGWLEKMGEEDIPAEQRYRLGGAYTLRGYSYLEIGGAYGRRQQALNSSSALFTDLEGNPIAGSNGYPINGSQDQRTIGLDQEQRDKLSGGGIQQRLFNIELLLPLSGPAFRSAIFYDAGQVNSETEQYEILGTPEPSFFDLRQSYGAGIRIITPLGVLRFEYGIKINPQQNEDSDDFEFTISSLF